MKLIFITQKLAYNDPLMGFTHPWVEAFARQVTDLVVIANEVGEVKLNEKARIYSLGKESGNGRLKKAWLLNEAIRAEHDADVIFCHQCPVYMLTLLPSNPFLRIPMYLWYAHGHLSRTAWIASRLARRVFTSSPYALTLYNDKKCVIGQGVLSGTWLNPQKTFSANIARMVHVGRLSAVKNILPMIYLTADLKSAGIPATLDLIGDPATEADLTYADELKKTAVQLGVTDDVHFLGGQSHDAIRKTLLECDITLNFSTSAAIDKSLIETTMAGLLPVSYNASFLHTLQDSELNSTYQKFKTAKDLIVHFQKMPPQERQKLGQDFAAIMTAKHDLDQLAKRIVSTIESDLKKR